MTPLQMRILSIHKENPRETIAQIARMAGCSYMAAYNVLTPKTPIRGAKVRPGLRAANVAIERTGYVPVSLPAFPWGEK